MNENKYYYELQTSEKNITDPRLIADIEFESIKNPTHAIFHKSSRFLYVQDGEGKIELNKVSYQLKPDTLISIVPWMLSQITEVTQTLYIYVLKYSYNLFLANTFDSTNPNEKNPLISEALSKINVSYRQEAIKSSFLKIKDLTLNMDALPLNLINSLFYSYLLEIACYHAKEYNNHKDIEYKQTDEKILNFIYENSNKKLTLNDISNMFFMSTSSISRFIHDKTGLSFFELLNEIRVDKACELLIHTALKNEEIALLLGFTDSSHFVKSFNNRMEMSPNNYRNLYRNKSTKKISNIDILIINYICNNYMHNLKITDLVSEFNLSSYEINKCLKTYIGRNFNDFLNYIRINQAVALLLSSDEKIIDIAFSVGYNSIKTFNRNFIKYQKVNASEFRKHAKINNYKLEDKNE